MASISVQLYQLGIMVLTGALIGFVFDAYRAMRHAKRPGIAATALGDALFWAMATLTVLAAVFYANWGEVRVYVFLGLTLGAVLYFKLASPLLFRLLRFVWEVVVTVTRFLAFVLHCFVGVPLAVVLRSVTRMFSTVTTLLCVPVTGLLRYLMTVFAPPKEPPETQ